MFCISLKWEWNYRKTLNLFAVYAVCCLSYRYGDVHETIICECVLKSIKFGIKVPNERTFIHYVCFCFIFAPNVIYYSGLKIWEIHIESATWRMLVQAESIKSIRFVWFGACIWISDFRICVNLSIVLSKSSENLFLNTNWCPINYST